MVGIGEKIRTLTLGNLHDLLDRAIDLNSVGALKQHIRDLEVAKDQITDEAVIAKGQTNALRTEVENLQLQIKTTDENIDLILGDSDPTNDAVAETLEARLIGYEEKLKEKRDELRTADETSIALWESAQRLTAKHTEMLGNLRRIESTDRATRAKERATGALKQAAKTGEVSVDNIQSRMQERATVADSRFERALGAMVDKVDISVVQAQAKQRIAERRAQLTEAGPLKP